MARFGAGVEVATGVGPLVPALGGARRLDVKARLVLRDSAEIQEKHSTIETVVFDYFKI